MQEELSKQRETTDHPKTLKVSSAIQDLPKGKLVSEGGEGILTDQLENLRTRQSSLQSSATVSSFNKVHHYREKHCQSRKHGGMASTEGLPQLREPEFPSLKAGGKGL